MFPIVLIQQVYFLVPTYYVALNPYISMRDRLHAQYCTAADKTNVYCYPTINNTERLDLNAKSLGKDHANNVPKSRSEKRLFV